MMCEKKDFIRPTNYTLIMMKNLNYYDVKVFTHTNIWTHGKKINKPVPLDKKYYYSELNDADISDSE